MTSPCESPILPSTDAEAEGNAVINADSEFIDDIGDEETVLTDIALFENTVVLSAVSLLNGKVLLRSRGFRILAPEGVTKLVEIVTLVTFDQLM